MAAITASARRGDIFLVNLDPVIGHEAAKIRPCVVISPDELNRKAGTVVMAPCTTVRKSYASRVSCTILGQTSYAMLDQIRTFSYLRLISTAGKLPEAELRLILDRLQEMFAI